MTKRRLCIQDYTVGWVCALPAELAAAVEMLDEEYQNLPQEANDTNLYTLGRIGEHNMVVACLPAGQIGTNSAAAVAAQMKSKFMSIRFGLMVGIGGGVPSSEFDIRLGDVVVSQPYMGHGGVIQYDFGRTTPGGFVRTNFLNTPPTILLNALAKLRANHLRGRSNLSEYLSALGHLPEFARETAGPDILFESTYLHVGGSTCEQCSQDRLVERTSRGSQGIIVHYGTIASGNQVMKDGVTRDTLSHELGGVLCFEMEAAGLMNSFPCLVIRGICDYADSHKDKRWQLYGAATAAACAKEVLSLIPAAEVATTRTVDEAINLPMSLSTSFNNLKDKYDLVMKYLNNPEARNRILTVQPAYGDTYSWLFKAHIGFADWLMGKTESSVYWIQGKPGSGKSTLMKFAMNHHFTKKALQGDNESPWIVMGYFFHDRGTTAQKSVDGFLREILYQLLRQCRGVFPLVFPLLSNFSTEDLSQNGALSKTDSKVYISLADIEKALMFLFSKPPFNINVCLFVDALDEHEGNHRKLLAVLNRFTAVSNNDSFRLRLCLAGRPENIFKGEFRTCPGFIIHEHTMDDIKLFATGRIQAESNTHLTDESRSKLNGLIADIIAKADGVFMWVKLVVDELIEGLCEGDSTEELKELLSTIPTELEELYTRAIRRTRRSSTQVLANNRYEAYVMFEIAIWARTPFTLYDFLAASLYLTTERPTYLELQSLSESQMERRLNSRSAGLLEAVGFRKRNVQFIHQTVKEFMLRGKGVDIVCEDLKDVPREHGYGLILRYLISLFQNFTADRLHIDAQNSIIQDFLFYAHHAELEAGIYAGELVEKLILPMTRPQQLHVFSQILIESQHEPRWVKALKKMTDCHAQLFMLYVLCALPNSLEKSLQKYHPKLAEHDAFLILEPAMNIRVRKDSPWRRISMILEILLDAGIGTNLSDDDFRSLNDLMQFKLASPTGVSDFSQRGKHLWKALRDKRTGADAAFLIDSDRSLVKTGLDRCIGNT